MASPALLRKFSSPTVLLAHSKGLLYCSSRCHRIILNFLSNSFSHYKRETETVIFYSSQEFKVHVILLDSKLLTMMTSLIVFESA